MSQDAITKFAKVLELTASEFRLFVVRCNSVQRRSQLLEQLETACRLTVKQLTISPEETQLYVCIQTVANIESPDVLMVTGLEDNQHLTELLKRANRERDKYVQNLAFPVVLWVSDAIHTQLLREAADLQSIAETVDFEVSSEFWAAEVTKRAMQDLDAILARGATRFLPLLATGQETNLAAELQVAEQALTDADAQTQAYLYFLKGRSLGYQEPTAQNAYEQSLTLWPDDGNQYYRAVVHYSFGDWWRAQTKIQRRQAATAWQQAGEQFERCVALLRQNSEFSRGNPPVVAPDPERGKHGGITPTGDELLARFINALGDALLATQQWEQLEAVAQEALALHQTHPDPFKLARAYGFLAEVALAQDDWGVAQRQAEAALRRLPERETPAEPDFGYVQAFNRAAYFWALAKAQRGQGQALESLATLQRALQETRPQYELELYVQILRDLQAGYWAQQNYVQAYQYKRQRRDVETEFGLRAFLGAGRIKPQQQEQLPGQEARRKVALEIEVSGRLADVERLLARVGDRESRVTVLYGPSGVGKSSLMTGGLMPQLWDYRVGQERDQVLPIYLRTYQDWVEVLAQVLTDALGELGLEREPVDATEDEIVAVLTDCVEQRRLWPVLVLDQFEEFFFVHPERPDRNHFFEFLQSCLKLLKLKVIFSMRGDYLYGLLNRPGLQQSEVDILSERVLYMIDSLSVEQAKALVQDLANRVQLGWPNDLVQTLLDDLSEGLPLLLPIELQIVGAQMQQEGIETVAKYKQKGGKDALVQQYFTGVIEDCGPENEQVAGLVLFALTNEQGQRPLKIEAELAKTLGAAAKVEQLQNVLKILVMSGLVVAVDGEPIRYQLVHDYLVRPIRTQLGEDSITRLIEVSAERNTLAEAHKKAKQVIKKAKKKQRQIINTSVFMAITLVVSTIGGITLWTRQEVKRKQFTQANLLLSNTREIQINEPQLNTASSLLAVEAFNRFQELKQPSSNVNSVLNKGLLTLPEFIHWQDDVILVEFQSSSPYVVIATGNQELKVLDLTKQESIFQTEYEASIEKIDLSKNGKYLAVQTQNNEIYLIALESGKTVQSIEYPERISDFKFSPNSQYLSIHSDNGQIDIAESKSGKTIMKIPTDGYFGKTQFTEDGKFFVFGTNEGVLRIVNLETLEQPMFFGSSGFDAETV